MLAANTIVQSPGIDLLHDIDLRGVDRLTLLPGAHRLTRPWNLNASHLRIVGEGAVIDGGAPVTGWKQAAEITVQTTFSDAYLDEPSAAHLRTRGHPTTLWEAPLPAGFNASDLGGRLQMWRGDTRLVLARSPTLKYVHATDSNITFKGSDIRDDYHDFGSVHLVLYESWTASMHLLSRVDDGAHVAYLASHYNAQWANQAAGSRYYVQNALELCDAAGEFHICILGRRPRAPSS
jgi:hypothetical protein